MRFFAFSLFVVGATAAGSDDRSHDGVNRPRPGTPEYEAALLSGAIGAGYAVPSNTPPYTAITTPASPGYYPVSQVPAQGVSTGSYFPSGVLPSISTGGYYPITGVPSGVPSGLAAGLMTTQLGPNGALPFGFRALNMGYGYFIGPQGNYWHQIGSQLERLALVNGVAPAGFRKAGENVWTGPLGKLWGNDSQGRLVPYTGAPSYGGAMSLYGSGTYPYTGLPSYYPQTSTLYPQLTGGLNGLYPGTSLGGMNGLYPGTSLGGMNALYPGASLGTSSALYPQLASQMPTSALYPQLSGSGLYPQLSNALYPQNSYNPYGAYNPLYGVPSTPAVPTATPVPVPVPVPVPTTTVRPTMQPTIITPPPVVSTPAPPAATPRPSVVTSTGGRVIGGSSSPRGTVQDFSRATTAAPTVISTVYDPYAQYYPQTLYPQFGVGR